jgi:hypothetical protein
MTTQASSELHAALDRASREPATERYVLRLYVTGMTPKSIRAVENVRTICEQHLQGRYDLEVIDIYQEIAAALAQGHRRYVQHGAGVAGPRHPAVAVGVA